MPTITETPTKLQFNSPSDVLELESGLRPATKPAPTGIPQLVGTWMNRDITSQGLVKLIIGNNFSIHGFGACVPTPCDWGTTPGTNYAENVTGNQPVAFTALYKTSFKETIIVGRLEAGLLLVETFDHFTDGSGRSNYVSKIVMEK